MERKKKKVCTVGIAYLSLMTYHSDLSRVADEYLLDFRKENLLNLEIKSLLPYQGLIFSGNKE